MGLIACTMLLTLIVWCVAGAKPIVPFLLFCTSMLMLYVFSAPSIANALVANFEQSRQNSDECISTGSSARLSSTPLVVLGGGIDLYVPDNSPYEVLNNDSLIRTLRATEFTNADTNIYLLGGGNSKRTLAENMRQVLTDLNVDTNNIIIETTSQSTHENAQAFASMLPPEQARTIRLLTSQLHVARAAATFEKHGYQVCHIGVDSLYSVPKPPVSFLPYLTGLTKSTFAFHEWLALTVYRIKGYL